MKYMLKTLVFFVAVFSCCAPLAAEGPKSVAALGLSGAEADYICKEMLLSATPGFVSDDLYTQLLGSELATSFAVELDSSNKAGLKLRSEVLAAKWEYELAAASMKKYLQLCNYSDHNSAVNWLRYSLGSLGKSELRMDLLNSIISANNLPNSIRAEATVNLAAILEGRGQFELAKNNYKKALELDKYQADAAQSLLRLSENVTMLQRAETSLSLLRSNPKAVNVAWELGMICRDIGLHELAADLYEYCQAVTEINSGVSGKVFKADFADALLDAKRYDRLIELFSDIESETILDLELAGSLVEAYRRKGLEDKANALIARMDESYKLLQAQARTKSKAAADIAWFNFLFTGRSDMAADWAGLAYAAAPEDTICQRVWVMTHINDAASNPKVLKSLEKLSDEDLYCLAVSLVRAKLSGESDLSSMKAKLAGFMRRGHPWRFAMDMLRGNSLPLPAKHPQADRAAELVEKFFDSDISLMAKAPEKFIAVDILPPQTSESAEPVEVTVKLRNISDMDIPVGKWGLFSPQLAIHVELSNEPTRLSQTLDIATSFPCGRYLEASGEVEVTVRLDVSELANFVKMYPLSGLNFKVSAMLDPVIRPTGRASALPTVAIAPVSFTRKALAAPLNDDTYYQSLASIVTSLKSTDRLAALKSVHKVVSLLTMAQQVKGGNPLVAGKIAGKIREPELLAILKYCLEHQDPAIRLMTLSAMCNTQVDEFMLKLAAPSLDDKEPLVRAKAVELFSLSQQTKQLKLAEGFAQKENDPLVRLFAEKIAAIADKK